MEVNLICIWLTLELGISDAWTPACLRPVSCAEPLLGGGVGGWCGVVESFNGLGKREKGQAGSHAAR